MVFRVLWHHTHSLLLPKEHGEQVEIGVTPFSVYTEKLFHTSCLFVSSHSYLKHRQNQLKFQTYPQTPCFGSLDPLSPGISVEVLSTFHITPSRCCLSHHCSEMLPM